MISPLSCLKGEDPVEESSINTGLQAGGCPPEMETSRFNGLTRPRCIQRCGLRRHHEKAAETA
jgi:hypothetical protein